MEQYAIKGGNPLVGEVEIGGAKNAALPILAASVMTDETVYIENMPDVRDTNVLLCAMENIGVIVKRTDRHKVTLNASNISELVVEDENIKKIRASYYLIGALLGKYKHAEVALPGGCDIGCRAIDQHIKGFRALGAEVKIEHGLIKTHAEHLRGSHIYMDVVSVGATINIMMAAVMAEGTTIIENSAKEPHVVDLANFLNSMGANIKGAGTDVIRIKGVSHLHGTEYAVIPDQIEAGTFMFAAAVTKGDVTVKNVIPKHLESISAKLEEMGVTVEEFDDAVRVTRTGKLNKCNIKTLPHPGFPTDMQPQIAALLSTASGTSIINESVWDNRFRYVEELKRMGAQISVDGRLAVIEGVDHLNAAPVKATDLRAGAAMLIAALAARGTTQIEDIQHIERGYEDVVEKLRALGADIRRVYVPEPAVPCAI